MSNYSLILNQFKQKLNCTEEQKYTDYELNRMLDKLAQVNAKIPQFNRDVSQQMYDNSPKVEGNKVVLRDFINTILRAEQILNRNIRDYQKKIEFSVNLQQNQQNRESIQQFTSDLQLIAVTFNLPPPVKSGQLDRFSASQKKRHSQDSHNVSVIFAQAPSQRQESTSLKIVFWLLFASLFIELILVFVRHHFLNCLAYVFVLGIYLLNYFDRSYIRTCLVILLVSVIADLIWAIVESGPYWDYAQSHRSSMRPGFLKFIYIMTIILMIARTVIMIILFRFRSNTEQTRKCVRIFTLKFDLDGRPVYSPVHNILNKGQVQSGSQLQP